MGHGHQHFHQMMARQVTQRDVTTINGQVVSVVYVTETPTFDGVIGGYSTVNGDDDAAQPTAAASASGGNAAAASSDSIPEAATATALPTTSLSVVASSRSTAASNTAVAGPAVTSSGSSANSSSSSSSDNEGMSTGAKAGLAIGIIAGIGLIAALLLWFIGKKKKEKKATEGRAAEDEKQTFGASRNAIGMQNAPFQSSGPAPRLSIRPMSKNLLGDFGFGGTNRRSAGNMLNTVGEGSSRNASPAPHSRAQTPPENPFADPQNPFADPEKGATGPPPGPVPRSAPPQIAPPVAPNPDRIAFTGSWPAAPAGYESSREAQRDLPIEKPQAMPNSARGPMSEPDDLPIMGAPTPQISMPSPTPSSPMAASSGFSTAGAAVAGVAVGGGAAAAAAAAAAAHSSSKRQERQDRRPDPLRTSPPQQPREERQERRPDPLRTQPPQQLREEPRQEPREEPEESPREAPREVVPSPGPAPSPAFAAAAALDPPSSPAPSATSSQAAAQNGGNVYRVLMDFAPSMDDELELKSGQLVRMLHEYDDGWALCIKLDRSHQGVVPRTCLAAKPSKPKPSHLGQYARNAGPAGRPMSPAGDPRGRPMSPAGGRNSPAMNRPMSPGMGRPMSPGMGRPMSPGMGRPMSPGMGGRPMSPAGSPMRPMSPGGRQMRPMSPAGGRGPGPHHGPPGGRGSNRPMSPGGFNQAPRPLSPGPMRGSKRSQSPGPYGAAGPLPMPSAPMRRRSNSASAFQERRMSPPGPSKLGPGQGIRPMSPAGMGMAI